MAAPIARAGLVGARHEAGVAGHVLGASEAMDIGEDRNGRERDDWADPVTVSRRPAHAIRNWVKQEALDAGQRTDGLTTEEHEELRRLRRENRQLREERAILAKAAAWFARETNAIPSKDSSS